MDFHVVRLSFSVDASFAVFIAFNLVLVERKLSVMYVAEQSKSGDICRSIPMIRQRPQKKTKPANEVVLYHSDSEFLAWLVSNKYLK